MKTWAELQAIKADVNANVFAASAPGEYRVLVGLATCGIAAGAMPVYDAFKEAAAGNDKCKVGQVGCIGMCQYEPIVEVMQPGKEKVTYIKMTPEKALEIVDKHLIRGQVVTEYTIGNALK